MKKKIVYILKYSPMIYKVYFHVVSFLVRLVGVFVRTDDKLILFNSFGGKKYDDSPRAIYNEMKSDLRFKDFRLVWALQEPQKCDLQGEVVKSDTISFFKTALAARVWVTNSSMERGLKFKKKETVYFNTWHGTALKKMGVDIDKKSKGFGSKLSPFSIMLAQSQYDVDIFSQAFCIPKERFRIIGLPRNDELVNYSQETVLDIRKSLEIPNGKKILLYAPTFREYEKGKNKEIVLDVPISLGKWQEMLGDEYVVLFRAHYEVARHMNLGGYPIFIDVSSYPHLSDLMIISDALITDYSSIVFDYSIMHKPVYCFAYDYDEYVSQRGVYFDIHKEFPCNICYDEDTLLLQIKKNPTENNTGVSIYTFQEKYATCFGNASKLACDVIIEELEKRGISHNRA